MSLIITSFQHDLRRPQYRRAFGAYRSQRVAMVMLLAMLMLNSGCKSNYHWRNTVANDTSVVNSISQKIDEPQVEIMEAALSSAPITVRDRDRLESLSYLDLTLRQTLEIAMQNSQVLRELGGVALKNPDTISTKYNSALRETDPRYGMEAALSAFDAQLAATAYFNKNDQTYNNPFFSGGTNTFQQDLNDYSVELSKRTVTGSRLALRTINKYDYNNAPSNTFPSAWDTYVEGEIRQPLLQGGGMEFNRIAGPGATPGVYNGLLIARVNNDISQTDFEVAVRDYVSNVVNAYWDLYFAYRDLDARSQAMKRSLIAWNQLKARAENDLESEARVALASEQYYRFKAEVDDALTGRVVQGTQNRNGSTGGTLRGSSGVQIAERRLRLLAGMSINDDELIRPVEEPSEAEVIFYWDTVMQEALIRRPELRRQQLTIHKRQMELLAARNFLNPRLDTVGRYRFRGFGHDLLAPSDQSSSVGNMMLGNNQEWYVGLEYTVPLGYRKGHLAVSNAEILLSRDRAILQAQEREVVHDLSNAIADAARAYEAVKNAENRLNAANNVLTAYETQEKNDLDVDVDRQLDAQRRVVEAEIRYYQAKAEYAVALKNVHLEKGSLLGYTELHILDGVVPVIKEPVAVANTNVENQESSNPEASGSVPIP
ncbi:MAG: TolC family protein [Planctomycetaceae bacterium]